MSILKLGKVFLCWGIASVIEAGKSIQIKLPITLEYYSITVTDSMPDSVCSAYMMSGNVVNISATKKSAALLYMVVGLTK